jgi:PIN domain nuclease of toxin-antitoxin system
MNYILDTHAFLWFISEDEQLSESASAIVRSRDNEIYFSAASAWEISIKTGLGRLSIQDELEHFLTDQLSLNQILPMPITLSHAAYTSKLPQIHKDPFDRILIAQSVVEDMPLVSRDGIMRKYDVKVVW